MKKPAEWAGFFDLYFYFTGLAEIVGQKKMRKWGGFACASSHISESRCGAPGEYRSVSPTLRFPTPASENRARRGPRFAQDGAPPLVAGSREIKGGPPALIQAPRTTSLTIVVNYAA